MDTESRLISYKKLFKSDRKMVSSDTTVIRLLKNVFATETKNFVLNFLKVFEKHDLLKTRLIDRGKRRRIGLIDGTFMGGHWGTSLTLAGDVNLPVHFEPYTKRGKELPAAYRMLKATHKVPGELQPHP